MPDPLNYASSNPALKKQWPLRLILVILGMGLWFFTQWLISTKKHAGTNIGDIVHDSTASWNQYLHEHAGAANALLISSSTVINLLAAFIFIRAIFGPSLRPFIGLVILFALRQLSQATTSLPVPEGIIWRDPGFPGGLVTYSVGNDFFFSGHTAIAVFGAIELARLQGKHWKILGLLIALFEIATVLILRAHYTLDVIAGIFAAIMVALLMNQIGPAIDRAICNISGKSPKDSNMSAEGDSKNHPRK
jgi:hypothetical protein